MEERITETALILPALYLINRNQGTATTSELIRGLTNIMQPTGEDILILENRNDSRFSQKVRNLKSHDTLQKSGFACYDNGHFTLTDAGEQHLTLNSEIMDYLQGDSVSYADMIDSLVCIEANKKKKKIEVFDEKELIMEGQKKDSTSPRYKRSAQLREYARSKFTTNGQISCACCGFNFNDFYGHKLGSNYIEIHHIKPIFKYEDDEMEKTLENALKNLVPVCPNCHKMIHRNPREPLNIATLKEAIKEAPLKIPVNKLY